MNTSVRSARIDELEKLIDLYRHLNPEDDYSGRARFEAVWEQIHSDSGFFRCLVIEDGGVFVSSCFLAIIPNLTRGGRPIGFIENVVTRPAYRRKGHARRILETAIDISWECNCYKIVLQSNRERVEAHQLYEKLGFSRDTKYGYEMRR